MSILAGAKKPQPEPMIATIFGDPGSGKTSLAATFPKPILLRTVGEAVPKDIAPEHMPDTLDEIEKPEQLFEQLMALVNEEHDYQTAIVDSASGLEAMFIAHILASDPKAKSMAQALGGYGAGRDAVTAQHARVRRAAEVLRTRRGMNVIFIAHADIDRIDPPDSEGYSRRSIRLHNKSIAPYVDSVDLVGLVRQGVVLMGDEGSKKAITTGERIISTYLTPASIQKNRYGITEDIEFVHGENPLAPYLAKLEKPKRKPKPELVANEEVNSEEEGN